MAPPTYFIPERAAALVQADRFRPAVLAKYGLTETFRDVESVQAETSTTELVGKTPSGSVGCVVTIIPTSGDLPSRLGYYPGEQDWMAFDNGLQIGITRAEPVAPADIARRRQWINFWLTVGGQEWGLPVIRNPNGDSGLPSDWVFSGTNGDVAETVKPAWLPLYQRWMRVADWFYSPEKQAANWPRGDALAYCVQAIGVNYRYGRAEQNVLRLVDSQNWLDLLAWTVDLFTFRDVWELAQKKRAEKMDESESLSRSEPAESSAAASNPSSSDSTDT